MLSFRLSIKCALALAFAGNAFSIPVVQEQSSHHDLSSRAAPALPPDTSFETTVLETTVKGNILGSWDPTPPNDPTNFLRDQFQLVADQMAARDGPVTGDQWVSAKFGIGLYARSYGKQHLTYGILGSAIKALINTPRLQYYDPQKAQTTSQPFTYTFTIEDGKWGQVAQAVVCLCPSDDFKCFVPYGLPSGNPKRDNRDGTRVNDPNDPDEDGKLESPTNLISDHDATMDFSIEVTSSRTGIEGKFIGDFKNPQNEGDSTLFLSAQLTFIQSERKRIYGSHDGDLPGDGVWVVTSPAGVNKNGFSDFGLGIRPVSGQKITFGILLAAVSGISQKTNGDGLGAPSHKKKPFTFDIYDAPWGLVGQGVLTECVDQNLDCFAPFGLQKPA